MKNPALQMNLAAGAKLELRGISDGTIVGLALGPSLPWMAAELAPSQLRPLIEWLEARESALIQAGKLSAVRS